MGQKTHPIGMRLGITRHHSSSWYATSANYRFFVNEDQKIRSYISHTYRNCILSKIDIERRGCDLRINVCAGQIKAFVGRGGEHIKTAQHILKRVCQRTRKDVLQHSTHLTRSNFRRYKPPTVQIFVRPVPSPESDAKCLAEFIITELERRAPFRRVIRTAKERAQNLGKVLGFRFQISGRLNGAEIARTEWIREGRIPLHTISTNFDYACKRAHTIYGLLGIKVWIYLPKELTFTITFCCFCNHVILSSYFMLSPKRVKYRKPHKRHARGRSIRGNKVSFGEFGLQATQSGWITSKQIESRRRVITRYVRRNGKLWIRIFPDRPVTQRPAETRMGSGKGRVSYWVSVVRPGAMIFEVRGITENLRRQAIRIAASKISIKAQVVSRLTRPTSNST